MSNFDKGCFYCLKVFDKSEIEKYVDEGKTALCPKCGVDSVVSRGQLSCHDFTVELCKNHVKYFEVAA